MNHHLARGFRSVIEDRDLSRAASERYLMLQALADRTATQNNRHTSGSRRKQLRRLLSAVASHASTPAGPPAR